MLDDMPDKWNCNILFKRSFQEEAKELSRDYPSLHDTLKNLQEVLKISPYMGEPLGDDLGIIPLKLRHIGSGQENLLHVITYVFELVFSLGKKADEGSIWVLMLAIYDNSTMSEEGFEKLIEKLLNSLSNIR